MVRERKYRVMCRVISLGDNGTVAEHRVVVSDTTKKGARQKAADWVRENSVYYDDRIDPSVVVDGCELLEMDEELGDEDEGPLTAKEGG